MKKTTISGKLYFLAVIGVMLLLIPKYSFNDPDTFWHIEVGRYMLAHRQVLHYAIHTFSGDTLPYVPHEFGFQLLAAALYSTFGWPGIYIMTAVCFYFLVLGMYRLGQISRKELGLTENHVLLLPFVLLISAWIYYNYFKGRPQMISSAMIVWFFVYLREYQLAPLRSTAAKMITLSLAISNIHAGVWLVIAVFTGMALLESVWNKSLTRRTITVFALVWLIGLLNPGGAVSLFYIFTVTRKSYNLLINEWQPLHFTGLINLPITLLLLFFAATLPFALQRKPFRYIFMLGILYLGVSNFKQNLFMWLFIPYFAAVFFETLPLTALRRTGSGITSGNLKLALIAGLLLNILYLFYIPPVIDAASYPVEEMNYILEHTQAGARPRVLSSYGSSGYVMFRGGNVLCDGRQDPFITRATVGVLGWNAFERSMYGFSVYLPDIVRYDRPDYLIVISSTSGKLLSGWEDKFGQPVYKGAYGSVFAFERTGAILK